MPERGEPGADVVDGDAHALLAQPLERQAQLAVVLDRLVLGELDDERPVVVMAARDQVLEVAGAEQGGGDVERQVQALGQALLAAQSELDDRELQLDPHAQRVGVEEGLLGRHPVAVLVGEPGQRLGADDAPAVEVDDRLQRDVEAVAFDQAGDAALLVLAPAAVEVDDLLLAAGALALHLEALAELVLEVAQAVRDRDEADDQAHGGDGELAGPQRQAGPPRAGVRLGGEQVGERVQPGEGHQADDAHLAPGRRALGLPPPGRGDRELGDGEHADERPHGRVVVAVGAHEGAERLGGE